MKKLNIALGLVALLAAATSCDKYDIYPEQYGKVMMLKDAGDRTVTIYATEKAQPCYISVMKSGHSPENPAQATVKILNDKEFGDYKEKFYGDRNFKGLVALDPDFYYLGDADLKKADDNALQHQFVNADDRYFGVNVVFDAQKVSDWRDRLTTAASYNGTDPEKLQDKEEALKIINDYTFVVPVGLFSETDTINADNQYVMVMPSVEYPTMKLSINSGSYLIEDVPRAKLAEDAKYREGVLEPTVIMSIPCSNDYGFRVKIEKSNSYVEQFNKIHTDIVLKELEVGEPARYEYCGKDENGNPDETYKKCVHFPKGVTEVQMPISIYRKYMDDDELDINYVIPFYLYPNKTKYESLDPTQTSKISSDMEWDTPEIVPDKVKKSLKLPVNDVKWEEKQPDGSIKEGDYGKYCFFVGYRVIEAPLEMTADNILFCNDAEPSEGSFEGLFDDDLATFFHSTWSQSVPRTTPYGSYFDFEIPLNTPINAIAFQVFARVHSNPMPPKEIALYYTTREKYNANNPDASYWTPFNTEGGKVKTFTPSSGELAEGQKGSGKLGWFGGIKKETDWLVAKDANGNKADFNVVRFCVLKNIKGEDCCVASNSANGYWNLAGMKIYGTKLK